VRASSRRVGLQAVLSLCTGYRLQNGSSWPSDAPPHLLKPSSRSKAHGRQDHIITRAIALDCGHLRKVMRGHNLHVKHGLTRALATPCLLVVCVCRGDTEDKVVCTRASLASKVAAAMPCARLQAFSAASNQCPASYGTNSLVPNARAKDLSAHQSQGCSISRLPSPRCLSGAQALHRQPVQALRFWLCVRLCGSYHRNANRCRTLTPLHTDKRQPPHRTSLYNGAGSWRPSRG
jgi:hypothetical protein